MLLSSNQLPLAGFPQRCSADRNLAARCESSKNDKNVSKSVMYNNDRVIDGNRSRGVRCRTAAEFETNFEGLDVVVTAAAHHASQDTRLEFGTWSWLVRNGDVDSCADL